MEVPFSVDEQTRINRLATRAGRDSAQLIREVMSSYLHEIDAVREMLNTRYDEILSGRVKPIDGEEAFARLQRENQERHPDRS